MRRIQVLGMVEIFQRAAEEEIRRIRREAVRLGVAFDVYRLFAAGDGAGASGGRPRQVEGLSDATAGEWIIPESGAFSLAKRGPRGELAAIRGDFGILSLT